MKIKKRILIWSILLTLCLGSLFAQKKPSIHFIRVLIYSGNLADLENKSEELSYNSQCIKINNRRYNFRQLFYPSKESKISIRSSKSFTIDGISFSGSFYIYFKTVDKDKVNNKNDVGDLKLFIVWNAPINLYLQGVLQGEVSASWPLETLKAQAIVSRSYAYAKVVDNKNKPYDVKITTAHQVFKYREKNEKIKKAVLSTQRKILTHKNKKPITAFFSASCGGYTTHPSNVWKNDVDAPYYKSVQCDFCEKYSHYYWTYQIGFKNIHSLIDKKLKFKKGQKISQISIAKKSQNGRVISFKIKTRDGSEYLLSANEFRLALGGRYIKSLMISEFNQNKQTITMKGRGFGHGVGLCQWGSKIQGDQGKSYRKIIKYYFTQIKISSITSSVLRKINF